MKTFVDRLEGIAEQCGHKKSKGEGEKDEFLRVKNKVYQSLEEVRETIHERTALLRKRGNCNETIQKGVWIRQQVDELKRSLPKLHELHKQSKKRLSKSDPDEHQRRYDVIRNLKQRVDEVQELFISANVGDQVLSDTATNPQSTLFGKGLRDAGRGDDSKKLLDQEEQDAIGKMRVRDQEIDKQVGNIGAVLDRLKPMAQNIGTTARQHAEMAGNVGTDVDTANEDLKELNKRVTEIMKYEKNTTFCCQLVLCIAFLCLLGVIFQQTS